MKKLNLFAIGVIAMLVAITSVAAENVETETGLTDCLKNTSPDVKECILTKDITVSTADFADVVGKKTIDLGTHTLTLEKTITVDTSASGVRGNLTVKNGKVDATGVVNGKAFIVDGKADLTLDGVTFNGNTNVNVGPIRVINDGGTLTIKNSDLAGKYLVMLGDNVTTDATKNAKVSITDTKITATAMALSVDGTVKNTTNTVTLSGNTFTSDGVAIYASGYATWNILSGTYKGHDAMSIRSGKITIEDGTFEATGNYYASPSNTPGYDVLSGSAITVASSVANSVAGNVELTINGGEFKAAKGSAVYEVQTASQTNAFASVAINGGTFEGGTDASVVNIKGKTNFVKGGTFIPANGKLDFESGTTPVDPSVNSEYDYGIDAEGNSIVGKKYTVKVKNLLVSVPMNTAEGFGYSKPDTFTAVAGSVVNLLNALNITTNPDSRTDKYAVRYTLTEVGTKTRVVGDKISGLTEFIMPESDVEIELEVVIVPEDTEIGQEQITPAPGTDTEDQGGNQGSDNQGSDKTDDTENPNTLDNVTSVAAMGGISLAIAAAGIATLKKREN